MQTEFFIHPAVFLHFFSYFFSSFISISDLQHQQCIPCCSHLSWSTNEFKKWSHQGRGALPMQSALPRTYLILVGYLADGRQENKEKLVDGCLYVKDGTGIIPCEVCPQSEGFCVYSHFWGSVTNHQELQMFCQSLVKEITHLCNREGNGKLTFWAEDRTCEMCHC